MSPQEPANPNAQTGISGVPAVGTRRAQLQVTPRRGVSRSVGQSHDTKDEAFVGDLVLDLGRCYDLSPWLFTTRLVIDEDATPHSHPVLTLGTRFAVRSPLGVLSAFIHEQIHWFLTSKEREAMVAIDELRRLYPDLAPDASEREEDEFSTYQHLIVNYLELGSLRRLVGDAEARRIVEETAAVLYGRIYRTVLREEAKIRPVIDKNGLGLPPAV